MPLLLRLFVLWLGLVMVTGCTERTAPSLRIGTHVWPGYEFLYLARDRQYLDSGAVQLVETSTFAQSELLFRNDLIDAATVTLDQALVMSASGEDLAVVLVTDVSNGADAIIGRNGIHRMQDIRGKRVGFENNILGSYILTRALEINQIKLDEITPVLVNIDEQIKAFEDRKIDVVITFDPVRSQLLGQGHHLLFDSTQLHWEIVDVLVVRRDYLDRYPGRVQHVLDAWYQALDYFLREPRQAAAVLGQRMHLDVDTTLKTYDGMLLPDRKQNARLLQAQPEPQLLPTARKISQHLLIKQLIPAGTDPTRLFGTEELQHTGD